MYLSKGHKEQLSMCHCKAGQRQCIHFGFVFRLNVSVERRLQSTVVRNVLT